MTPFAEKHFYSIYQLYCLKIFYSYKNFNLTNIFILPFSEDIFIIDKFIIPCINTIIQTINDAGFSPFHEMLLFPLYLGLFMNNFFNFMIHQLPVAIFW